MQLDRRKLLITGVAAGAATALPRWALAQAFAPQPGAWRTFEITTRLELKPEGKTQAWVPLPSVNEQEWSRTGDSVWTHNGKASVETEAKYGARMLHVTWSESEKAPVVEVKSTVQMRDRAIDLGAPGKAGALSAADRKLYTESTALIPTGGIVKTTSDKIVGNASTDVEKTRAIYDWVVTNTFRDAKARGCGIGDIKAMLTSNDLGGKCADLNALLVGLLRAQDIPARDVYGIRVAPSRFGYKSLGANSPVISKAQHCRAEVHLAGHGWVAIDPADVRKVALEEPPANLAIDDPKVAAARKTLFGAWEGNWLAYNFAHDVVLPGSSAPALGFFMYPQAETASYLLDCLDPDSFKYTINSRETTPA